MLDELGGPETYNHYPTGWAFAFSTPFRMFKRYSYQGGICDPMVIHWPKGIKAKGEVRNQYHHVIDIVPTILECVRHRVPGVRPRLRADAAARRLDEVQLRRRPDAPTTKETQYYAMLGTRGIWHEGWKAVAVHGPTSGIGHFDEDRWQLFHTDDDRAEAHDLADRAPREGARSWSTSGSPRPASTTCSRSTTASPLEILLDERPSPFDAEGSYVFYPGTSDLPEHAAPNLRGRSFKILATVEIDEADAQGVLFAHGARFGGHSPLRQGRQALLRQQLPRHPARAAARVVRRRRRRQARARHRVRRRSRSATATRRIGTAKLVRSTTRPSPRGRAHPARSLRAVRRGPLRSAATAPTR